MSDADKTRMIGVPHGEKQLWRYVKTIIIEYRNVTDGRTDRFAIWISRISVLTRDKNYACARV